MMTTIANAGAAEAVWQYSRTARILHWTLASLIAATAALGWYMMSVEHEPGGEWYFNLHKSIGLVIAALVVGRIAWRLRNEPERLPAFVPLWQVRLSTATQMLLYALMVLMPLTGYLGASYTKAGVQLFGLATPHWAVPDHARAEQFFAVHSVLIWVLTALVALHVLGALKHLLLERNGVFQRMWFTFRP